jgi:hypothetical protein
MLNQIVFSTKSSPMSFAGSYGTVVSWRGVNFLFMAFQVSWSGEVVNGAGRDWAFIWSEVFVHVLPECLLVRYLEAKYDRHT